MLIDKQTEYELIISDFLFAEPKKFILAEHENPNKDSEPGKHVRDFLDHKFDWKILLTATTNTKLRKILGP